MASLCRAAAMAAARTAAARSRAALPKPLPLRRRSTLMSRPICAALGAAQSLMPLHSATAAARLKSFIAEGSSRWSWLSRAVMATQISV